MKLLKETEDKFNKNSLHALSEEISRQESMIREGGGEKGKERQQRLGRLTARERLARLLDDANDFFELGVWAAYKMYADVGEIPAAGVITGIGQVAGHACMLIVNDATVKAGAMFPQSVKKVLRAQRIAYECRLPIIYLVDSSGVYLPMQDEIFPDEDDFGRIFRNNSVISAAGIPQYSAIMGNCIAGGAYLPVLCDKLLMTEGSGLYLAGPALVKAAIGHEVNAEELGGTKMHTEVSGTVDFYEPDDPTCLKRLKSLVEILPSRQTPDESITKSANNPEKLYEIIDPADNHPYDAHDLLSCIIDEDSLQEYKAQYGQTLITGYAKIGGFNVGVVASQRKHPKNAQGEVQFGGVIYADSADKAARFIMDCNQMKIPLIFFQDVMGFMVGKEAEQSGILRSGAKLVNAVSNSIVPKITVIVGSTFGAGNYALCGKAYDPNFILAWPNAKYAVMGADQAAGTLFTVLKKMDKSAAEEVRKQIQERYESQTDIRYGAARGWLDAIIAPHLTRDTLIYLLKILQNAPLRAPAFHTGVIQT